MNFALGCAFNVEDLFIHFPVKKLKISYIKLFKLYGTKNKKYIAERIFKKSVELVLSDIIENNTVFYLPGRKSYIRMNRILDEEFKRCWKFKKFRDVDFIKSFFTGHQLMLYMNSGGRTKEKPIYVSKKYKNRITELTNEGKLYG